MAQVVLVHWRPAGTAATPSLKDVLHILGLTLRERRFHQSHWRVQVADLCRRGILRSLLVE